MNLWSLVCHGSSPTAVVRAVQAAVSQQANGALLIQFEIDADIGQLHWPAPADPGFADGLWRHTCCELFVGFAGQAYREFNFSPSMQFAAYDFDGYRLGMRRAELRSLPQISADATQPTLRALLPSELLDHATSGPVALGITAVIEERGGYHSYWSLFHGNAKPDFHDRAGFVLAWSNLDRAGALTE